MSTLTLSEQKTLENFLGMSSGYVLDFSDRTFAEFISETADADIHDEQYTVQGTSKAKKLRSFWKLESNTTVARLLLAFVEHALAADTDLSDETKALAKKCEEIANRLLACSSRLGPLKVHAKAFNAQHLAEQIHRMEAAVDKDPSLAIGTAKELIETCCKTILAERGKAIPGKSDIPTLTKETMKELRLVPDGIPNAAKDADVIKRMLNNLGTIGAGLAELRNLYGTGHGKHGNVSGLSARHAKLAVGAAATLATFLFETHVETKLGEGR